MDSDRTQLLAAAVAAAGGCDVQERATIIERFREKRKRRVWKKKIRYNCRKNLADRRIRVKGRFVKAGSKLALELAAAAAAGAHGTGASGASGSESASKRSPCGMEEEEDDDDDYEEEDYAEDMDEEDDNNNAAVAAASSSGITAVPATAGDVGSKSALTKRSQSAMKMETKEYVVSNRSGSDTTTETAADFTPRNTEELSTLQLQGVSGGRVAGGIAAVATEADDAAVKAAAKAAAAEMGESSDSTGQDEVMRLPSGKRMRRHSIAY